MAKSRSNSKLPNVPTEPQEPQDPLEGELGPKGDPMSPMTAWLGTNPGAATATSNGDPFLINCQRNAYTYALRRAGYNVEALPNVDGFGGNSAHWDWNKQEYVWDHKNWRAVLKNPDAIQPVSGSTYKEEIQSIRSQMAAWGDGAIAMIAVSWKGGNGHIFVAEQINGETVFMDTQVAQLDRAPSGGSFPDVLNRGSETYSRKELAGADGKARYAGSDVNIEKRMSQTKRYVTDGRGRNTNLKCTQIARLDNAEYDPDMLKRVCTVKSKKS